jgi:hypothetical protein
MGECHDPVAAGRLRRRLSVVAWAYLMAAAVFGLFGVVGVEAVVNGVAAFGVPWTVAAAGTIAGVVSISLAASRARFAVDGTRADTVRIVRAVALARQGRLVILIAAVGTVIAATALVPVGDDELTFVVSVNVGLAVALALFAAVADDVGRAIRLFPLASRPVVKG